MSLLRKSKKQKKYGKRELSGKKRYDSEIDDYEDEYEEEEYYEDGYDDPEEEYYEGDESDEYYEEEYYEDEESDEYAEEQEYYEEEYYSDDVDYYGEAGEEDSYEEEDEDLYYVDEGEYEDYDDDDDEDFVAYRRKKGVAGAMLAFRNLPVIDKVIAFTGVAVLVFAVLTGTIFIAQRNEDKAAAAFVDVGTSLQGVTIIGESGLLAVADAQLAKETAAEIEEEAQEVVEEPVQGANVSLKMTSIVKDLKIKFVNTSTDKLVANVPFQVEVTSPSKKTETWTDDDKDGVIYKENIEAGTYKVKMLELTGYDDYKVSAEVVSAEVKANIDYKKVDVKEEIKTEAEVNAAVEDTAIAEVVEESKLTDTVPFVKSTQTNGGEASYTPMDKNTIKDPGATASVRTDGYYLMAETKTTPPDGTGAENSGNTGTGNPGITDPTDPTEPTEPTDPDTTDPDTTDPDTTDPDTPDPDKPENPPVDPNPPAKPEITISVDPTSSKIKVGGTVTINAAVQNNEGKPVTWTSSGGVSLNTTSGSSVVVTGKTAGQATVTAACEGKSASCSITVEAVQATLSINPTAMSLMTGQKGTITATTNQNTVSWTSSDANVASVTPASDTKSAVVEAKKAGKAAITVTAGDVVVKCDVTVTDAGITLDKTSPLQVQIKQAVAVKVTTVPDSAKITKVESRNTKIATAAVKDKTVTVTGVALGETEVVITCDNGKEAKLTVKVVNNYMLDTTTLLKDKNGNQVYVYENGKYRKAVYADYYKFNEFYIETTEILYTGWQNINGKTYYYLENHKYVTGEQVIQGAKYTFASDGSLVTSSGTFGIDVSKWNGSIDWNSVKASGASYAIIRCGYRGSTTGALITDPKFAANISGANAAGLKVGVYFFTQAVNEKEAVEEASMVLDLVKKYKISYPIFLDVEASGGRADGIDKGTRTAVCKAFCATIQNSGYTAGVYANKTWLNSKIDAGALGSYKIWLAQYAAAPNYGGRYNLWQYSSKGSVPGIKGNVDMNQSYLGY